MMYRRIFAALLALLCVFCLCGCGANLPEGFTQEEVLEAAKATLEKINAKDLEAVTGELREDLKGQITAEQLGEAWGTQLDSLGAFLEIKDYAMQGTKDQTGEEYAVAVLSCTYENGTAIYTLSYDSDYALVGLYMK